MSLGQAGQALQDARGEGQQGFAGPVVVVQAALAVVIMDLGVARQGLLRRQALIEAIVALPQARLRTDGGQLQVLGRQLRRMPGPRQVRAIDGGEVLAGQDGSEGAGLRLAGRVQADVELALDAPLGVPGGFPVTDQAEAGHGGVLLA